MGLSQQIFKLREDYTPGYWYVKEIECALLRPSGYEFKLLHSALLSLHFIIVENPLRC